MCGGNVASTSGLTHPGVGLRNSVCSEHLERARVATNFVTFEHNILISGSYFIRRGGRERGRQ